TARRCIVRRCTTRIARATVPSRRCTSCADAIPICSRASSSCQMRSRAAPTVRVWWWGSDVEIEESRRLVPHQNATTMQVAISVVAACLWMLENPRRGLCVPDDLPHDYVLDVSKPYLGKFISVASDWNPLQHYSNVFRGYNRPQLDTSDPWQFTNFLITEGD